MKRISTDILVVGAGGAGLMAACEAARHSARVALVSKGRAQRSGATIMAPGAIAAVDERWKNPDDSPLLHLRDTLRGGGYLNNQQMAARMVERAPELVLSLERMGALFQRESEGKKYMLRTDGGHTRPRSIFLEDRTGKEMARAMVGALRKFNVPIYEEIFVTRVIVADGAVAGAAGICVNTLEPVLFEAKSVILATGGGGTMYENTDNSIDLTADGYAIALDAGLPLRDMEFVQFYPVGFLAPSALRGMLAGLLYYSRLYNADGERFMSRYDPERLEMSTRDRVSRAIMQEVREGRGTPLGGVYMDLTFQPPGYIAKMTPALYATYRNIGIDPQTQQIEIAPTVHFFMGGLDVDADWATAMPGLFGAGEVCGGTHGGNRLSQNALAEILVSGEAAGQSAARHAERTPQRRLDPAALRREEETVARLLKEQQGVSPGRRRAQLKHLMWEDAGVFRTEQSLRRALETVEGWLCEPVCIADKSRCYNRAVVEALENRNMMLAAQCVALSALERRESCAAHYRSDYPQTDRSGPLKNILVQRRGESLCVDSRPVELCRLSPKEE